MVIDETELEGLTEDQRDAYIALKEGRNVFLSGNAGTGKSDGKGEQGRSRGRR